MYQTLETNKAMRQMAVAHNERWVRKSKSTYAKAVLHNKKSPKFVGIVLLTTLVTIAGLVIMVAPQVGLGDTAKNMLQTVSAMDAATQADQAAKVNNLADSTFLLLMPAALMLCFYVAIIISKINGKLSGGKNF